MHHICALALEQCPVAKDLKRDRREPCEWKAIKCEQRNSKADSKHPNPNGLRKGCPICNDDPTYRNLGSTNQMLNGWLVIATILQKKCKIESEFMDHGKFCLVRQAHKSEAHKPGKTSKVMGWVTFFTDLDTTTHLVSMAYNLEYTLIEDDPPHKEHVMTLDLSKNMRVKAK
ncbi:hypothetical protein MMC15_000919 [Xylographa vitiligo]|nr:hypothetical protein [Xylographa vitiligo]